MTQNFLLPIINFEPAVMKHGKGSYLYDTNEKKYLDLNSGQFCTILGHCNSEILSNINESMNTLSHTASNILAEEVIKCADKIHTISGEMSAYSIFLSTGAESVEFALRYSKFINKKSGIICFDKGYHGLTLGTQSVTFGGKFANPHISDIYTVPVPDYIHFTKTEEEYINEFANLVHNIHHKVSAVIMEPVVSVGGMLFPSSNYFQSIRLICNKYNLLLIFDESQTGFGRLGTWFAYQQYNIIPDIVCLAKGIGLGYPVSMVLFRDKLITDKVFTMTHYSSHQNDAFAASIVNAGIKYIEKYNLLKKVKENGQYFLNTLQKLCAINPHIKNPRGLGLMLGADLFFSGIHDYRNLYHKLYERMMENGVIIQGTCGGKILRFLPDYLISHSDIDFAINTLNTVLSSLDIFK